jgi:DNA-binding NtrC family response regulator
VGALGYTAIRVRDAAHALSIVKVQGGSLAFVLSDVMMPDVNGVELRRLLTQRYPNLCVILMSGHGSAELARHGLSAGGGPFLPKPFDIEELARIIAEVVDAKTP